MKDRLLSNWRAILQALVGTLAPYAVWEYRVVSVDSAAPPVKVSVRPTSDLNPFGPQAGMTLWPGPSGTVAVPQVGSLVRLQFADGSPTKPMIVGLDPNAAPTMVFVGEETGPFAARVGDSVAVTGVTAPTPTGLIFTAPSGGGPCVVTQGTGPTAYKLTGTITSGSSKVQVP